MRTVDGGLMISCFVLFCFLGSLKGTQGLGRINVPEVLITDRSEEWTRIRKLIEPDCGGDRKREWNHKENGY